MQATHPTRLHLARPLIITVLALTLALVGFVARAALSMEIDPSSGAGAPATSALPQLYDWASVGTPVVIE